MNVFANLKGRVLVTPDAVPEKSTGGIILMPSGREKANTGIVEDVSSDVTDIQKGNKVYFHQASVHKMKIGEVEYFMLNADEILGVE